MAATSFQIPKRAILTKEDLERFQSSDTFHSFLNFIASLSDSVRNKKLRDEVATSQEILGIIGLLDELDVICAEIPPEENEKSRFGNPAFRTWFDKVNESIKPMVTKHITGIPDEALDEVCEYLMNSFGNRKRIDYGTGHESAFMAFLYCLTRLELIKEEDYPAVVLKVFWRYINLMRSLQFGYLLEPAGSHGVWGLDDYHFLPFWFGSAQLMDHKHIRPKSIHDAEIVEEFSKDYMYLACIQFINSVKTASLRWHSPMLDDISGVKKWSKVNSGMQKMYIGEVLNKLPIMQHFLFGSFLPFEPSDPESLAHDDGDCCGHSHYRPMKSVVGVNGDMENVYAFGQEAPVCCGIKIPSAIGAASELRNGVQGLRKPLPFD